MSDDGIAVTDAVVSAMTGQPTSFEVIGTHELKGVPGEWALYCVGAARP